MTDKTMNALWTEYETRRVKGKRSAGETTRYFEKHIGPSLGARAVSRVTFEALDDFHRTLKETPYQANRILSVLRAMFSLAEALRWVKPGVNPARSVRAYPEKKRRRHLKPAEAPAIAKALIASEPFCTEACVFIWLCIFTGARPGEIKSAKWGDLTGNKLSLEEHKTDARKGVARIIMLPPLAMEKLALLERGHPESKIISLAKPEYLWRRLRVESKCYDLRLYDLRHTFGTYALENGYNLDQIGEALDHTDPKTTKIYAEMNLRSRNKIAADVSTAILKDMLIVDDDEDPLA